MAVFFRQFAGALLLYLTAGCAVAPTTTNHSRDPDVITLAELESVGASTAYDVVERLRPAWLRMRPGADRPILVYDERSRVGDVSALRQFSLDGIHSLRYLDRALATSTLPGIPPGGISGAIIIMRRRPG
jgi:hypothetical protein